MTSQAKNQKLTPKKITYDQNTFRTLSPDSSL